MNSICSKLLLLVLFVVINSNSYSQNLPSGLIAYWNMDEVAGAKLTDYIGGNNASCNFSLNPDENGWIGFSQYFDFKDKAVVENDEIFNFPANASFTITYWMKFTETQYGLNGGQDHIIISKGDWQTGGPYGALWASGVNGSGKVNFLLSDDTGYKIDLEGDNHYNDGKWHFVACVRDDATDESYLYADGEVVDYKYYDYSGSFTNSDNICMAHLMNQSEPEYYYMGSIDEIGIYNRALSYDEINELKSAGNAVTSISNIKREGFSIFPVPAKNNLNILFYNSSEASVLEIFDITGRFVKSIQIPANTVQYSIDLQEVGVGTYSCRIRNSKADRSSRFIVIK